jgi:hypothetical protein
MKCLVSLLLCLPLAGCSKVETPSMVPVTPRVYTVDELLAQPLLRKRVSAYCSNDPGRTSLDPNCANARRAEHLASAGSGIPDIFK